MAALARVHQRAAVHGPAVVPIPGNGNRGRLEENTAATRLILIESELEPLEPIVG
jgi:diketogulonate reductase-like aldo/keto reductase